MIIWGYTVRRNKKSVKIGCTRFSKKMVDAVLLGIAKAKVRKRHVDVPFGNDRVIRCWGSGVALRHLYCCDGMCSPQTVKQAKVWEQFVTIREIEKAVAHLYEGE